jgi:hypothetical protein
MVNCPYCKAPLPEVPKRTFSCPFCDQPVHVRHARLRTEQSILKEDGSERMVRKDTNKAHQTQCRGLWRCAAALAAFGGVMLLVSASAAADPCPQCSGAKTIVVQCDRCAGLGILEYFGAHGEPIIDGCPDCGGKRAVRDPLQPGKAGSGQNRVNCPTCGGTGAVEPAVKDEVCPRCQGAKTIIGPCPMCGGTGIAGSGTVHGQPVLDGCTYCGGRPTPRNGIGSGAPGSGRAAIPCPDCNGTGHIQSVNRDDSAWRAADNARRVAEQKARRAREDLLAAQLTNIKADKNKIAALEELQILLGKSGPSSELKPIGGPASKLDPGGTASKGGLSIDRDLLPTDPQIAELMRGLRAIKVPPPMPADQASIDFRLADGADEKSKWILLGTDVGVIGLDLTGKLAGKTLLGTRVILATGKTIIAMEDGADLYLVRQNELYEQALKYLKVADTAPMFTAIVQALKEGRPLPENAHADMIRAARAILDPRLGNSGKRIAWSAMWSPEAKRAGLTKASIELGGELFGEGVKGIAKDLTVVHDPAFQYASASLKKAQIALAKTTDPTQRAAIQKVIEAANDVLKGCYRISHGAEHAASIFAKEADERGLKIEP